MSASLANGAMVLAALFLAGSDRPPPPASAQVAHFPTPDAPASSAHSGISVIPFELADNLVRIAVDVNGQRRSGVLDSGAGAVLIDRKASRELSLHESGSAGEAAGAGSEVKQLLPVTISQLKAGPFRFESLAAYAVDLGNLSSSAGFPVDVLLGAPAFQDGTVSIDYARRRVTVDRSGSPIRCASPIPLDIVHDTPVIEIEVRPTNGDQPVRLKVIVDLGTRHSSLVLGGAFVRSEAGKKLLQKATEKEVGYGVGGAVKGAVVRVAGVSAADSNFGPLEVSLTSDVPAFEGTGIDGTLGVPVWNGGVIAFDYAGRRLCITSPSVVDLAPIGYGSPPRSGAGSR